MLMRCRRLALKNPTSPSSPLLRLPPELRNRVYQYVFTTPDDTLAVGLAQCLCSGKWVRPSSTFALSETCKQIHNECSALPYTINTNLIIFAHDTALVPQMAAKVLRMSVLLQPRKVTFALGTFIVERDAIAPLQALKSIHESHIDLRVSFTVRRSTYEYRYCISLADPDTALEDIGDSARFAMMLSAQCQAPARYHQTYQTGDGRSRVREAGPTQWFRSS